jgi:hypothetical protein
MAPMPARLARPRGAVVLATAALCVPALTAALLGAAPSLAAPARTLALSPLDTFHTGAFDEGAAEIVAHDTLTQRLFVVNAEKGALDVLDAADPADLELVGEVAVAGRGAADGSTIDEQAQVNSVSVSGGVAAVAVEAGDKVSRGWVAFFSTGGDVAYLGAVRVGTQPDMVTFTPDGSRVVTADEAEPADDFSSDPEGTVSIVDVAGALGPAGQSAVRTARFTAFEGGVPGVRVVGPDVAVPAGQPAAGRVSRNLEPEYVAVDQQSRTAYVTLQENNAIAVVDLRSAQVRRLLPLGLKDWTATAQGLDASDRDGGIDLQRWPVRSLFMPDAIAAHQVRGVTYLVSANEGDVREWGSYVDAKRLAASAFPLCPEVDPTLTGASRLGRLLVSEVDGTRPATATSPACREQVVALGARSLSVWTTDGRLVADTGSTLEELLASGAGGTDPAQVFNANHDSNTSFDARSDDKGPEPEGVTLGKVAGRTYAFLGLERASAVVAFDVTDPTAPTYAGLVSTRDFTADPETPEAGDLGPEGLAFVAAEDSPTGRPLLAVGNEVSGTTTVFDVAR